MCVSVRCISVRVCISFGEVHCSLQFVLSTVDVSLSLSPFASVRRACLSLYLPFNSRFTKNKDQLKSCSHRKVRRKAPKRRERVGTAQKEIRKKQCKVRVCVYVCVRVCECVSFPSLPLQKQKSIFQIHDNYPRPKQQKFNNQLRFSRLFFLTIRVLKKISSFRCGIFVWRSIAQTFPELSFALALFLALSCRFAAFGFHNFVAFRLRIFIYILFRFHCVSLSVNLNCPLFGKFKIRNSPHQCQNIVEKAHTILIVLHSSRPPAVSLTKYYMIYPRSWCIYFVQNKYK